MAITENDVDWTKSKIRTLVRNLTGRPSTNQISDDDLDIRINRFYVHKFPGIVQMRDLATWWRFSTLPNVANYSNVEGNFNLRGNALLNGEQIEIIRDPEYFYDRYPQTFQTQEVLTSGDGATTNFTGSLNKTSINQENFSIDDNVERLLPVQRIKITDITQGSTPTVTTEKAHGLTTGDRVKIMDITEGMVEIIGASDTVTVVTTTTFTLDNVDTTNYTAYLSGGFVYPTSVIILSGQQGGSGTVTVSTGAYNITFGTAPSNGQSIRANYEFNNTGMPNAALFYNRELSFSPIPDAPYFVQIAVDGRPSPLLLDTDKIASNDWGRFIAFGTAIDLLEEFGQQDTAALLIPTFQNELSLIRYRDFRELEFNRAAPRF